MPIIVLGCGKGGTSLVAELLARMGVDMGTNLPEVSERRFRRHDPTYQNFEHREIRVLNHSILADTGHRWWDPPTIDEFLAMENRWHFLIMKLITGRTEPWGWKCGLNAVMIPLFHKHLIAPKYVVIRRMNETEHIDSWVKHRYRNLAEDVCQQKRANTIKGRRMIYDRIDQFLARFNVPESQICELTFEEITNRDTSHECTNRLGDFISATPEQIEKAYGIIEYDEP